MEMKHRTGSGFDADAIDHTTAADLAAVGSDKWTRYPGCIGAFIAEMDYGLAPCIQKARGSSMRRMATLALRMGCRSEHYSRGSRRTRSL